MKIPWKPHISEIFDIPRPNDLPEAPERHGESGRRDPWHTHLQPMVLVDLPSGKRLQKTMERSTIFNGKTHYKWSFSIAFCMFTIGYHL